MSIDWNNIFDVPVTPVQPHPVGQNSLGRKERQRKKLFDPYKSFIGDDPERTGLVRGEKPKVKPANLSNKSLKLLEQEGYAAQSVESYNYYSGQKKDLFNFIDILAVRPGEVLGLQVCAYASISARRKKALAAKHFKAWLSSGARFVIHGWKRITTPGGATRWECVTEEVVRC